MTTRHNTTGPRSAMRDVALDELMAAARRGETEAWQELHRRFNGLVLAMARRQGLSQVECDDVAQTTWMRLVEKVDAVRNDYAVPAWLATTATREAYTTARRRGVEIPTDDHTMAGEPASDGDLDEALDTRRQIGRLRSAIGTLPERERRLIETMLRPDEPTYREISERLNMPIGAIGPVRQRAVRRLQVMLASLAAEPAVRSAS